jgi:dihydroflavonol-4-reductase
MKVLVTGATGIVGSNLVRALLDASHQVRVLVRPSSDARGLSNLPVERCEGDILDLPSLCAAAKGRSLIFHAAAVFSYWGLSAEEQRDLAERGTRNILEAARKARSRRVIVTSSSVVLGSSATGRVLDEESTADEPEPSAYTRSKMGQEAAAFSKGEELGVEVVAVCPTLVVGGFDYRLSPSNANIVNYLNDPLRSTFIGGCNIVSAQDVAAGHILAAERGRTGARYVLGSENLKWPDAHGLISELTGTFGPALVLNHTAAYLAAAGAEAAARLTGTRPLVTRDEARMSGRFYWYSHQRMAELGYAPAPARRALAEAIAWLWVRSYLSDAVMGRLELSAEVRAARARFARQLAQ